MLNSIVRKKKNLKTQWRYFFIIGDKLLLLRIVLK
jgi:hypothetical protein